MISGELWAIYGSWDKDCQLLCDSSVTGLFRIPYQKQQAQLLRNAGITLIWKEPHHLSQKYYGLHLSCPLKTQIDGFVPNITLCRPRIWKVDYIIIKGLLSGRRDFIKQGLDKRGRSFSLCLDRVHYGLDSFHILSLCFLVSRIDFPFAAYFYIGRSKSNWSERPRTEH